MGHSHSRRSFLKIGLTGATVMSLPRMLQSHKAQAYRDEPHFFLQLCFLNGLDASYLFDARPLAMTAAGKIQNYLNAEPELWMGSNGQSCLATSLVAPLKKFRNSFSIINGVHMATQFDGHEQNTNLFFAGNPFGGESFVPHLNEKTVPTPLDFLQVGSFFANLTNTGGGVPLSSSSARQISDKLRNSLPLDTSNRALSYAVSRMQAASTGPGTFSNGSKQMFDAMGLAPQLADLLKNLEIDSDENGNELQSSLNMLAECFRNGVATSAILGRSFNLDAHDDVTASGQPETIRNLINEIVAIFEFLSNTPFDHSRSLFDVTTIAITSEFSRTMRQDGFPIDKTGTDHNSLSNTVLMGGKGIRGGLVLGASDFQQANEVLSGAHKQLDPDLVRVMGRTFDFSTFEPRNDVPEIYEPAHYLNCASVINTIYSVFGVPTKHYRVLERNAPPVAVLRPLLS